MIVSIEKAAAYIGTEIDRNELADKLLALEFAIRKYSNNNFQNRNVRSLVDIATGVVRFPSPYLKVGDTVQITDSAFNNGLFTIKTKDAEGFTVNEEIYDEEAVLVTKVEYPADVQMGAIEIMRWKLKNETANYDDTAPKEIQSESISRHSVTYAKDATESDIDAEFGVPRKYTSFLKMYKKARF